MRLAALYLGVLAVPLLLPAADVVIHGRVIDDTGAPVRQAHVSFAGWWEGETDPTGAFDTAPVPANTKEITITIEREGYYTLTQKVALEGREYTFVLNTVHEIFQSENVKAQASPVDVGEAQHEEHLSGTEVNDIPYANSHSFRNALELLPGVIQDPSGAMHTNGADENQVLYLFNGFNINNPIDGRFRTLLPVEGIRSVDLSSGQTGAEFGKGSAGVMQINTESGTDRFRYTATDFIPGVDIKHGVRLGNWYPRVGVSGPIEKGRAWFANTFESEYTQALVNGLPSGANTRSGWAGANTLHGQVNLSASNLLFADFLVNIDNQARYGLAPLDPVSTTYYLRRRGYLASVKDQKYFGRGMLVEAGYAHNYFSKAQTPQGDGVLLVGPEGQSGYAFQRSLQKGTRDEGLAQVFLPKFAWLGAHQLQAGADFDWLHYDANFHRTGYDVLGLANQVLSQTVFSGSGVFGVSDTEVSAYVSDSWRITEHLQATLGFRVDHDAAIRATGVSPRLAFSWVPLRSGRTKVSGGFSRTHDVMMLETLGEPRDQVAVTTMLNADGTVANGPYTSSFMPIRGSYSLPRATNWSASIDQQLWTHVFAGARYLRRRSSDEFLWLNTLAPNAPPYILVEANPQANALYQLTNTRQDSYDSISFEARQTLRAQFGWTAAYTWSRSLSNAVLDPATLAPVQRLSTPAQTLWNVPHRFILRGYTPLPWKDWAASFFVNGRSGFPFSVRQVNGLIVGGVDAYRYPFNFDLNLAVERMITLRGYRFALRGGVDNLTGQANPTAVNRVLGTANFLQFLGDEGRHYVVRVRFFERSGK